MEKAFGLKYVKPNQKLILRVQRPKSIMIGDFKDDYVISVPRSVSPYKGQYFYKMSHNCDSKHLVGSDSDALLEDGPQNENSVRIAMPRIRANTNFKDQREKRFKGSETDILNVKGTSAQFTLKKIKAKKLMNTPRMFNHLNGALTKIVISKRGRPYKIRNNSGSIN